MVFCLVHDVFAQHVLEWAGSGLSMHAALAWQQWIRQWLSRTRGSIRGMSFSSPLSHKDMTGVKLRLPLTADGPSVCHYGARGGYPTGLALQQGLCIRISMFTARTATLRKYPDQLLIRLNKQRTLPAISRPDHVFRLRSSRIPDHQSLKQDSVLLYMCYIVNYFNWTFWILRLAQVSRVNTGREDTGQRSLAIYSVTDWQHLHSVELNQQCQHL